MDQQQGQPLAPQIPDDIEPADLDREVRAELLSLSRPVADQVARHLVAAGQLIDEDADEALAHALAARRLASRIAAVREAVGLAAYAAGDWQMAIAELRTYHRMSGRQTHLAVLADCERGLGRPERAIDLFRSADRATQEQEEAIELLIVAAGARGDLGQHDAAVAMLQVRELAGADTEPWAGRLRYAYADALLAAGRRDEAREWFARAATADEDGITDAAERLLELDGVVIEGDDQDDDEEAEPDTDAAHDTDAHGAAGVETDVDVDPHPHADRDPDVDPDPDSRADRETDADGGPDTDVDLGPDTDVDAHRHTDSDDELGTDRDADTDLLDGDDRAGTGQPRHADDLGDGVDGTGDEGPEIVVAGRDSRLDVDGQAEDRGGSVAGDAARDPGLSGDPGAAGGPLAAPIGPDADESAGVDREKAAGSDEFHQDSDGLSGGRPPASA